MAVLQTFLVLDDFDSFEEGWSGISEGAPLLGFDVFLMVRPWSYVLLGRKTEVPRPSHRIKGPYCHREVSLLLALLTWLGGRLCQRLSCEDTLTNPRSLVGRMSLHAAHSEGVKSYVPPYLFLNCVLTLRAIKSLAQGLFVSSFNGYQS